MIKRVILTAILLAGILPIVFAWPSAAEREVTDKLIERIKQNCTENLASLNRLRQTDAFLRNDRGELYRTISDKLMLPLNQRMLENELDASTLVETTANFNKEYRTFYQAYIDYDNAMAKLVLIDCSKEPVTFYTVLEDARARRTKLNASDQALVGYVKTYKSRLTTLKKQLLQAGEL